jgi:hypothetical protein
MLQLEHTQKGNWSPVAQPSVRQPNHRRQRFPIRVRSIAIPPALAVCELLALFYFEKRTGSGKWR